jgi:hypothetical protein
VPARFRLVAGVRIYPDGREVAVTREAWERRRREAIARAGRRCECREDCESHRGRRCNRRVTATMNEALFISAVVANVHHKKRRGMGGGHRDDRLENLECDCPNCHVMGPNK